MIIMDTKKLHSDIWSSLQPDPIASVQLDSPSPHWSINSEGFLLFDKKIYVPDHSDLRLHILQYEISEILDSHIDKQRKWKLLYLVKWAGYKGTDEETSWLPASKLGYASEVILDFHLAYPSKPGPLPLVKS